jgi:hypothetical protein
MPNVKPDGWDKDSDRNIGGNGVPAGCVMYDLPTSPIADPVLNPPEEE